MKTKLFLLSIVLAWLAVMAGCGDTKAPSGGALTVNPSTLSDNDGVLPYDDAYIYTTVTGPNGIPMNGINVTYEGLYAYGQTSGNVGVYAFLNSKGQICPTPCTNKTDERGISVMKVRLCTTVACNQYVPLPSSLAGLSATSPVAYKTNIYVSSGSLTPASVAVQVNQSLQ